MIRPFHFFPMRFRSVNVLPQTRFFRCGGVGVGHVSCSAAAGGEGGGFDGGGLEIAGLELRGGSGVDVAGAAAAVGFC